MEAIPWILGQAITGVTVFRDFLVITALDYAPDSLRRKVLSSEYEGSALEQRLQMRISGGWSMLAALWKMARVNRQPALKVGDTIGDSGIHIVSAGTR